LGIVDGGIKRGKMKLREKKSIPSKTEPEFLIRTKGRMKILRKNKSQGRVGLSILGVEWKGGKRGWGYSRGNESRVVMFACGSQQVRENWEGGGTANMVRRGI